MARQLAPGDVIGGFRLEQKFHHGGNGTLWKVSRADIAAPLVMKLPFLLPGEDPLTIVSYETEQMIMPRLSGSHAPAFIAAGQKPKTAMLASPGCCAPACRGRQFKRRQAQQGDRRQGPR